MKSASTSSFKKLNPSSSHGERSKNSLARTEIPVQAMRNPRRSATKVPVLFIAVLSLSGCRHTPVAATVPTSHWQDAFVMDHATQPIGSETKSAVAAWAHIAVGRDVSTDIVADSYHIASNGIVYLIACIRNSTQHPCPNITVKHRTIVSVESTTLHILDDDGVEQRVEILEKVAEKRPPNSMP